MYSPNIPYDEYLRGEQLKYPELKAEDVETLKQSFADDPTIPPISDKKWLAFLHSCYFDQELARKTVKKCYRIYRELPEVFCDLDPLADCAEQNYRCMSTGFMPTVNTDNGDRVLYFQFRDYNVDSFDYASAYKYLLMWLDYSLTVHGTCDALIVVFDTKGLSWRHIMKLPMGMTIKMLRFLQYGLSIRLKTVHLTNSGMATTMLIKIVQKFASEELMEKVKVHSPGSQDIFRYIPRKMLPVEAGGLGKSHKDYNDELFENLKGHCNEFYAQNDMYKKHLMSLNQPLDDDEDEDDDEY